MPTLVMNDGLQKHTGAVWTYRNLFNSTADTAAFVESGFPATISYSSAESAMVIYAQYYPDGGISSPKIPVPANTTIYQKTTYKVIDALSWGLRWKFYNSSDTQVGTTQDTGLLYETAWTTINVTHTGQATQAKAEMLWYTENDMIDSYIYINDLYLYTDKSDQYGNPILTQQTGGGPPTLSMSNGAQKIASTTVTLTQKHVLVVSGGAQKVASGKPTLTVSGSGATLVMNNGAQKVASTSPNLIERKTLVMSNGAQKVASGKPTLTTSGSATLTMSSGAQKVVSTSPALVERKTLVMGSGAQKVASTKPTLTVSGNVNLTMNGGAQRVTSGIPAVSQRQTLVVNSTQQRLASTSPAVGSAASLSINSAVQTNDANAYLFNSRFGATIGPWTPDGTATLSRSTDGVGAAGSLKIDANTNYADGASTPLFAIPDKLTIKSDFNYKVSSGSSWAITLDHYDSGFQSLGGSGWTSFTATSWTAISRTFSNDANQAWGKASFEIQSGAPGTLYLDDFSVYVGQWSESNGRVKLAQGSTLQVNSTQQRVSSTSIGLNATMLSVSSGSQKVLDNAYSYQNYFPSSSSISGWTTHNGGSISWSSTEGSPNPGSMAVTTSATGDGVWSPYMAVVPNVQYMTLYKYRVGTSGGSYGHTLESYASNYSFIENSGAAGYTSTSWVGSGLTGGPMSGTQAYMRFKWYLWTGTPGTSYVDELIIFADQHSTSDGYLKLPVGSPLPPTIEPASTSQKVASTKPAVWQHSIYVQNAAQRLTSDKPVPDSRFTHLLSVNNAIQPVLSTSAGTLVQKIILSTSNGIQHVQSPNVWPGYLRYAYANNALQQNTANNIPLQKPVYRYVRYQDLSTQYSTLSQITSAFSKIYRVMGLRAPAYLPIPDWIQTDAASDVAIRTIRRMKPVFYDTMYSDGYSPFNGAAKAGMAASLGNRTYAKGASLVSSIGAYGYKRYYMDALVGSWQLPSRAISYYIRQSTSHVFIGGQQLNRIHHRHNGYAFNFNMYTQAMELYAVTSFSVSGTVVTAQLATGMAGQYNTMTNGTGFRAFGFTTNDGSANVIANNFYTLSYSSPNSITFSATKEPGQVDGTYMPPASANAHVYQGEGGQPARLVAEAGVGSVQYWVVPGGGINVNDNQWHHVGINLIKGSEYSSATASDSIVCELYIDGVFQGIDSGAYSLADTLLVVGEEDVNYNWTGPAAPFEMAHYAVFDRKITGTEFNSLYAAFNAPPTDEGGMFVWTGRKWINTLV
jgi:hypothetical protein